MEEDDWITPQEARNLRQCGAPMGYIRALDNVLKPNWAKTHDYSEPYGVYQSSIQRRGKKAAQRAVFEMAETLTPHLGKPRSVRDPSINDTLCFEWTSVPGWTLSISAEFYSGDSEWCETAVLIHRRFADRQTQRMMDHHVKVALWGDDPRVWPKPYTAPPPPVDFDEPEERPEPAWVTELNELAGKIKPVVSQPALAETDVGSGSDPAGLEDLFVWPDREG